MLYIYVKDYKGIKRERALKLFGFLSFPRTGSSMSHMSKKTTEIPIWLARKKIIVWVKTEETPSGVHIMYLQA